MFIWICKYCASILNHWNTRNATCQQDGGFPLSSPSWRKRCSHTTFWEIWTIGEQQIFYHPRLSGIVTKILILPTDGDLTYSKIQSPFLAMVMMRMMTTTVMMRMIGTTMKRWRLWWSHRRVLLKRAIPPTPLVVGEPQSLTEAFSFVDPQRRLLDPGRQNHRWSS